MLAISTEVIDTASSSDPSAQVAGVTLYIKQPYVLPAGAVILAALFVAWYAVLLRVQYLRHEIEGLYKGLGYPNKAEWDPMTNPFHSATFYGALIATKSLATSKCRATRISLLDSEFARWLVKIHYYLVSRGVAHFLLGLLPIGTEVIILSKLVYLWYWWLAYWWLALVPFTCTLLTSIAYFSYFKRKPENA